MIVRVLGTAAGGGLPQWNCGCAVCVEARASGRHRWQDGLAVTGNRRDWFLVNASPDLRAQLLAWPEFSPPSGTRASPIRGVLLTSGELDHTLGLLSLRESTELIVYATATVWHGLPTRDVLAAYTRLHWVPLTPGQPVSLDGGLVVTPFAPGTKPPRYATRASAPEWTVALCLRDSATGRCLVYAPGLAQWSEEFAREIAGADVVLLDGTFSTDGELPSLTGHGHLSIADTLPRLPVGPRYAYTHLNNTNPYALQGTPISTDAEVRTAEDGDIFEL
jgi:pyrroloquinoline quinone biosynthesis protein B